MASDMNPIARAYLQLIAAKQEDEQLAQRKAEADAANQFRLDNLNATIADMAARRDVDNARMKLQEQEARERLKQIYRSEIAGGLRKVQGTNETVYPDNMVELPREEFVPSRTQTIKSEMGDLTLEDVVSFPELSEMKRKELIENIGIDILKAGGVAQAQEAAKAPNINAQIQGRADIASYNAEQTQRREELRAKTAIEVAKIRARATAANRNNAKTVDESDIHAAALDAKFGLKTLGATNTDVKARTLLRSRGEIPMAKADADSLMDVKNLEPVLEQMKNIGQYLGTNNISSLGAAAGSILPNSPLRVGGEYLRQRGPLMANVFGVKGTQSDKDISQILNGIYSPTTTRQNMDIKVQQLADQMRINVLDIRLKGMSNIQKLETMLHFDLNPEFYNRPVKINGKESIGTDGKPQRMFEKEGDEWTAFNPKTKKWEFIN